MEKVIVIALCTLALFGAVGYLIYSGPTDSAVLTGIAKGFGGDVTVSVTKQGDKIVAVKAEGANETKGIGTKALEQLPQAIVKANSTNVEVVSGATITSKAIIYAVNNALDPVKYPVLAEKTKEQATPTSVKAAKVYQGFGLSNNGRLGPGKDKTGTQVYSVNQVFANILFDEEGRILSIYVDQLEVATPNYDGEGMPHFSGFPGQGGYNNDANHDGTIVGKSPDTQENFLTEVANWVTKRDRGDNYIAGAAGTWTEQMNVFQELFIGKTVAEVEEWFEKYTSSVNGRPLKADSAREEDKAKYNALSDTEKAMLADVTSGATISLNDSHGNIIEAIKLAYEKRVGIDIKSAAAQGFGLFITPRVGPGKDAAGTQVYSINQVFANTLFDEEGKIASIYLDQLEIATPNYDGEGMPHFSGFPGQGGYNHDTDHDGKIDGKTSDTQEGFLAEITGWVTKRDRGDDYIAGLAGTWTEQINVFEKLFIGKTVGEVEEWFNKYTSSVNGRPLKADSSREEDKAKYNALSDTEKAMLADVTSGATISLNDSHGNIIQAIKCSFENRFDVNLAVK